MTNYTVASNTTQTSRITMAAADTLTVQANGTLNVSGNAQAVRFTASANGAVIDNFGIIEATGNQTDPRAIRFEDTIGNTLNATITNEISGTLSALSDVIQVDGSNVTTGTLTITNNGLIDSTNHGRGLDLAGLVGTSVGSVTNSGTVKAFASDGIRFGLTGSLTNSGTITGGYGAVFTPKTDGVDFIDNSTGTLINSGAISSDRHGVNGGLNSTITVTNQAAGTITGHNGSGVGSDGSASVTNFGTITGAYSNSPGSDENSPNNPGHTDGINDGDGDGVDIDFIATIDNHGTIQGTGAGGTGSDGLANYSEGVAAGGGTITNRAGAVISGFDVAITIDNGSQGNSFSQTTIVNDGTIETTQGGLTTIGFFSNFHDVIDNGGAIISHGTFAIQFGSSDDTLKLRAGSSITGIVEGGTGINTVDYSAWTGSGISFDGHTTSIVATGTSGLGRFLHVIGSAQDDTFQGSGNSSQSFIGGLGDDLYINTAGAAIGEDMNGGSDTVQSNATYSLSGLGNVENLTLSGAGPSNGTGNELDNAILGNAGVNTLTGGDGNDSLDGAGGGDSLVGGIGNDTFYVDTQGDAVNEAASQGSDTVVTIGSYTLGAGQSIEYLAIATTGASINNSLTGNALANTLLGDGTDNTLNGGGGADTLIGGAGNDIYVYATGTTIQENVAGGSDTVNSAVTLSLVGVANVENLTLTGGAAADGTGNDGDNRVTGNTGANYLSGGIGEDTLVGGAADTLAGGTNDDTYIVSAANTQIVESDGSLANRVDASVSYTLQAGVSIGILETTAYLGSDAINLTGNALNQQIFGNAGANALTGGGGADTMTGFGGNDTYRVDSTTDQVVESAGGGADTVFTSVGYALQAGQSVDLLATTSRVGTGASNLTGNELAQRIDGNYGNNILTGGGGGDTMYGFLGNDTFVVSAATDRAYETAGQGSDTVFASLTYALQNSQSIELLATTARTGTTAITLTGNELAQRIDGNYGVNGLYGGDGNDTLYGFDGNDRLGGGNGQDVMDGGAGLDIFTYSAVAQSKGATRDLIQNINFTQDRIDLQVAVTGIDTKVVGGTLNESAFDGDLATAIGVGQLAGHHAVLFDPGGGTADHGTNLYLVVDVNGAAGYQAGADYVFELQGAVGTLGLADFI